MDKKPGRPPSGDPRSKVVTIRLTESEKALVDRAVRKTGLSISVWMRVKLLTAARRAR